MEGFLFLFFGIQDIDIYIYWDGILIKICKAKVYILVSLWDWLMKLGN